MFRLNPLPLIGMILIAGVAPVSASPPDDPVAKHLSVQSAMVRARAFLNEMKSQKAVEVLEEQLPNVTTNPQFLVLLREAYRACIRDQYLAGQPDLARRYLDRLCILDPAAANDKALRPQVDAPPRQFEHDSPKETKLPFPLFKIPTLPNPFARKEEPKAPQNAKPSVVRAQADDSIIEDPFDRKNQRETRIDSSKTNQARDLLARGMSEFSFKRYADAKLSFEEAFRIDPSTIEKSREPWAYCIIEGVSRMMDQPGALPGKRAELQKQVDDAVQMAPTKMKAVGQQVLQKLDERAKSPGAAPPMAAVSVSKVRHLGANKEGWHVAESKHFRVFYRQDQEHAERVAEIAENTRQTMYRKWFDADGGDWQPVCEVILHPTSASYTQMTGAPGNSPGHSRIDAPSGRVIARRMDLRLDIATMMQAVLPHETTHIVLAGNFGDHHVPRWADEGIAVLSEPAEKIELHRRNLLKHHREKELFGLKELMELNDYPHPRRIPAFYAQSVVLVEFLTQQRGPKVLPEFVKDGLRHGYETALQRHYGMSFTQLEQRWQQQVIEQSERVAATK